MWALVLSLQDAFRNLKFNCIEISVNMRVSENNEFIPFI